MANGTFTVTGLKTGLPSGGQSQLGPLTVSFSDVEADVQQALVMGSNTVTVPAGSPNGVWIIPPAANTATLELPGSLYISPQVPTSLAFDTVTPNVPTSFVITASGSVTVGLWYV